MVRRCRREPPTGAVTAKVDADGTLVIPEELRDQLGVSEGGESRLTVENGELRGSTRLAAFLRLHKKLASLALPGDEASAIHELIAVRRTEAVRDEVAGQV